MCSRHDVQQTQRAVPNDRQCRSWYHPNRTHLPHAPTAFVKFAAARRDLDILVRQEAQGVFDHQPHDTVRVEHKAIPVCLHIPDNLHITVRWELSGTEVLTHIG